VRMKFDLRFTLVFLFAARLLHGQAAEPLREWKTAEGKLFQAAAVSYDGRQVVFRMPNGSKAQAPVEKLAPEEQQWLEDWQKRQPIRVVLPDVVAVDAAAVKAEVVSEDPGSERFVYRTQNFEFESQGKFSQTLLREIGRNFEATRELLAALPWGIRPSPESGKYFRARLFRNRDSYLAAGGPQNSSGVYMGGRDLFMVPFESIGVKTVGKAYTKDEDFRSHTLVHELTHQMMHGSLRVLPQWVVEGTAEYTATLPFKAGRFRVASAKSGLKDYLDHLKNETQEGVPEPYNLEKLFAVSNQEWNSILQRDPQVSHRLYFTSYLLVYYFMHLDGKGDGQSFARYFREIGAVRSGLEAYGNAVEAFKKVPGVEVQSDGSYRFPASLKHPEKPAILESPEALTEFQRKTLAILQAGRSEADLLRQIRSAYAKLGIRL
jgi:hypothetical protein